ncbi:hypothetical protein D3C87_1400300 [compost metagenome]
MSMVAIILLFFISGCSDDGLCVNNVSESIDNSNHEYVAYVFERDCGSTTQLSYQVSVLKKGVKLGNPVGNVISSYNEVKVSWSTSDELLISTQGDTDIFKQETQIGSIKIKYHISN